jgi:sialidase-1
LFLRGGASRPDRILIPAYHTEGDLYRTHALFSDDHGETWQLGADAADHTSEPQVIELDGHTLLMNARTIAGHGTQRTLVVSKDRGNTWQAAEGMADLTENNCQGCIYKCFRNGSDGQYDWIFSHPISSVRTGVHAWISDDQGKSWPSAQMLWSGPSAYSSMVRVQGGLVGLLIECGTKDVYEQIAFVKFAPEWLKARKAPVATPAPSKK